MKITSIIKKKNILIDTKLKYEVIIKIVFIEIKWRKIISSLHYINLSISIVYTNITKKLEIRI